MGYNARDLQAMLDSVDPALFKAGYDGTDATGVALDLSSIDFPETIGVYYETKNGSASDVVDIDVQHSSDDGSSDAYADVPEGADLATLEDADGHNFVVFDASDFKKWVRLDLASGDQTVSSTIDVIAVFISAGAFQSGTA